MLCAKKSPLPFCLPNWLDFIWRWKVNFVIDPFIIFLYCFSADSLGTCTREMIKQLARLATRIKTNLDMTPCVTTTTTTKRRGVSQLLLKWIHGFSPLRERERRPRNNKRLSLSLSLDSPSRLVLFSTWLRAHTVRLFFVWTRSKERIRVVWVF